MLNKLAQTSGLIKAIWGCFNSSQ